MIKPAYWKPLQKLAARQVKINELTRSVISTPHVIAENNYPLYLMIKEVEGLSLSDPEILPHVVGQEAAELIGAKCLTSYWLWFVLRNWALKSQTRDCSIADEIEHTRSRVQSLYSEQWQTSVERMKPAQIAEFTAYGFLLWDSSQQAIVPNPIFF